MHHIVNLIPQITKNFNCILLCHWLRLLPHMYKLTPMNLIPPCIFFLFSMFLSLSFIIFAHSTIFFVFFTHLTLFYMSIMTDTRTGDQHSQDDDPNAHAPDMCNPDMCVSPPPCVCKTHLPTLINHFKALSLRSKLDLNLEIELHNRACELRHIQILRNPPNPPDTAPTDSDDESIITISDKEWTCLSDASIFDSYFSSLPIFVWESLTVKKCTTLKSDRLPKGNSVDIHRSKHCCIDGTLLKNIAKDPLIDHPIPNIFYDTIDEDIDIPLHFFKASALIWASRHASEIHIQGSKPIGGKGDDTRMLVIAWLSDKLASDESREDFTFPRWLNASNVYLRFQVSHDVRRDGGDWSKAWFTHFRFFENKPDTKKTYPFWRDAECEFRTDISLLFISHPVSKYQSIYRFAQSSYRSSLVAPPPPPSLLPCPTPIILAIVVPTTTIATEATTMEATAHTTTATAIAMVMRASPFGPSKHQHVSYASARILLWTFHLSPN